MQGIFSQTSPAEVLRAVFGDRLTGELIIKQSVGHVEKHIFFERGQMVYASSNQLDDHIGETLVRHNKFTNEQMASLIVRLVPGNHFGQSLVEAGVLTERELINYISLQFMDIFYSIFACKEGTYQFVEGEGRAPEDGRMKFSTASLILESIRRSLDFDAVRKGIGSADCQLVTTAAGRSRMQAIAFNPTDITLLNVLKEPTDLLKALTLCKDRPEKTLQSIYGLLCIGCLEQIVPASSIKVSVEQPATQPTLNAEGVTLTELEALKQRIATRDARQILGVALHNNPQEIYDAYLKLATRFHPEKFPGVAPSLKAEIDAIFSTINESYSSVRDAVPVIAPPPVAPAASQPVIYYVQQPTTPPGPTPNLRMTGNYPPANPQNYPPPSPQGYNVPPPANQPFNPFQVNPTKRSAITRAVSDELDYRGERQDPYAPVSIQRAQIDVNQAFSQLLDYFDDKRAPLFAAEALTTLLRTEPPQYISKEQLVEKIINWARNKSTMMGWPITIILLRVVSLIKQAEQAQLIEGFNGDSFYPDFINGLVSNCNQMEADEFMRGLNNL